MTPILFDPAADRDLDDIAEFLHGEAGYNTSFAFLASVEKTLTAIATLPYSGIPCRSLLPGQRELRRFPIANQFGDWLLFYRVFADRLQIIRILHGKQNWITILR